MATLKKTCRAETIRTRDGRDLRGPERAPVYDLDGATNIEIVEHRLSIQGRLVVVRPTSGAHANEHVLVSLDSVHDAP